MSLTPERIRELAAGTMGAGGAGHVPLVDDWLRTVTSTARATFDAVGCSVASLDEEHGELAFFAASGEGDEGIIGVRMPISQGIAGYVVSSGQALAVDDVRQDPRFAADVAASTGYLPTSILASPVRSSGEVVGVLSILDRNPGAVPTPAALQLAGRFADQAAVGIDAGRAIADLGGVVLGALAAALDDEDASVAESLRAAATDGADPALATLVAAFADLSALGPDERDLAARIVADVAAHARGRRTRR